MAEFCEQYMIDYVGSKREWTGATDAEAIPLFRPRRARRTDPLVYHAGLVCQYALAQYDLSLAGEAGAAERFLRYARWLERSAVEEPRGRFRTWRYAFGLRTPPTDPGWISGMTQGQALSVLLRAHSRTGDPATARIVCDAAAAFLFDVDEGGVVLRLSDGSRFIEEVVGGPPTAVLNGCLYGICGLVEFLQAFPDAALGRRLDALVAGVSRRLPDYDTGYWSRYCLGIRWCLAPDAYHRCHVQQLRYLGAILGEAIFHRFAERWNGYGQRRIQKARRRVVASLQRYVNRVMTVTGPTSLKYRRLTAGGA